MVRKTLSMNQPDCTFARCMINSKLTILNNTFVLETDIIHQKVVDRFLLLCQPVGTKKVSYLHMMRGTNYNDTMVLDSGERITKNQLLSPAFSNEKTQYIRTEWLLAGPETRLMQSGNNQLTCLSAFPITKKENEKVVTFHCKPTEVINIGDQWTLEIGAVTIDHTKKMKAHHLKTIDWQDRNTWNENIFIQDPEAQINSESIIDILFLDSVSGELHEVKIGGWVASATGIIILVFCACLCTGKCTKIIPACLLDYIGKMSDSMCSIHSSTAKIG